MKKRVLAGILMLVFVLTSAMGVSAADSKTSGPKVTDPAGKFETSTNVDSFDGVSDSVKGDIKDVNSGKKSAGDLFKDQPDIQEKVKDKDLVTDIFDFEAKDGGQPGADGNYDITVEVPSLTDDMSDVTVTQFNPKTGKWEEVKDVEVDLVNKTVKGKYPSLGPVAIFAKTAKSNPAGTSPATGVSSTWMIWTMVALIAFGAGVVVLEKKRR